MNKKRIIAARGNGRVTLIEETIPEIKPGSLLIEVLNSWVSPGSEVGGWRNLHSQQSSPSESQLRPFGYANAGIVEEVGECVTKFKP